MRRVLPAIIRTTTFRLALAQAAVFTFFASALLSYVYFATAGQLTNDAEQAADDEYYALAQAYNQGGINLLNQEVIERAAASGQMLYLLADQTGEVISGDFNALPRTPSSEDERVVFPFEAAVGDQVVRRRARGRVGRLLGGPILLVARDMGDAAAIVRRISRAVWTGAVLGLVLSLVSGLIASRQAVRRIQEISRTTRDVMAGDLSRRAPAREFGDEFDALAVSLNAMLTRLEKLVHSTRTAGDAIAHDLRTPLARMRQRLEGALAHPPQAERDREALRAAAEETEGLLATFNAVMRLARLQTANDWRFERVDVTAIAQELAEFYAPAAEDKGLGFVAELASGLTAKGDHNLITQALVNLIENAMKFTPEGGRIVLTGGRLADGRVQVRVIDSGPGIPASERERAVERFVRLESARSTPGAGLGLSLVSAVAELHKGELRLGEGLGGPHGPGLSAALTLPAA